MLSRAAYFLLFFFIALLLSWNSGAFQAELGDSPDEPAHYVTGLMVHDYVAQGFPGSPMAFARNYYLHYPKVALGHWPPFFYVVQASWTLVFGVSRLSLVFLMAAIGALLATRIFFTMSSVTGLLAALLWLTLPFVQQYNRDVMVEGVIALTVLLATDAYGRYLDTERWQPAAWFGLWATLALLTKGTGMQLAMVPVVAVLLTKRWGLLTRGSFWLPALIVAVLAGPWYVWVPGAKHESVGTMGGVGFIPDRLLGSLTGWVEMLGIVLAVGAVFGLWLAFKVGDRVSRGRWIAGFGALVGAWFFRLFIGAYEDRHLTANLPILVMAAVFAGEWLWRKWKTTLQLISVNRPLWSRLCRGDLWVGILLPVVLIGLHIRSGPVKRHAGYSEVAARLVEDYPKSVILVCADVEGEGMLIAEVAMREARPGHYVLRGTKMLATVGWMGGEYTERFDDTSKMVGFLDSIPVGIVVLGEGSVGSAHGRRLASVVEGKGWEKLPSSTGGLRVYRAIGHEGRAVGKIEILMKNGTFGNFSNQPQ